jgi:hypothetical protein
MTSIFLVVKKTHKSAILSITTVTSLFLSPLAYAQWDAGATMDLGTGYGQTTLNQSILSGTRNIGSQNDTDKSQENELRFYWNDNLSRQFQQKVVEDLGKGRPDFQQKLADAIEELSPTSSFQSLTYKNDMSMHSIPDLIAMYCTVEWEIVKGRQASPEGIHKLRDNIRDSMLQQKSVLTQVRSFEPQAKQFWLETLAYKAMFNRAAYDRIIQQGTENELQQLRSTITKDVSSLGIDIQSLEL